ETRAFNASPAPQPGDGFTATQSATHEYDALGLLTKSVWDDGQAWYTTYDPRAMPRLVEYATTDGGARQTLADYGQRSTAGYPRRRDTGTSFGGQSRAWTYDLLGRLLTDRVT